LTVVNFGANRLPEGPCLGLFSRVDEAPEFLLVLWCSFFRNVTFRIEARVFRVNCTLSFSQLLTNLPFTWGELLSWMPVLVISHYKAYILTSDRSCRPPLAVPFGSGPFLCFLTRRCFQRSFISPVTPRTPHCSALPSSMAKCSPIVALVRQLGDPGRPGFLALRLPDPIRVTHSKLFGLYGRTLLPLTPLCPP